ncbi:hypothetical protein [Ruminococcus sp.]|uniref:hypothetical protein n=1 Tax=Ruminococcus sp. TaxID=41978 RepID=UPI0025E273D2|nr:hypothetical protein [Ruminococcus sp.]MBQ8965939.1 hypothetical protein [Ruminococcus sp.]
MSYEIKDSLGIGVLGVVLAGVLNDGGFRAVREFTDFDSRAEEECQAVWSVEGYELCQEELRADTGLGAVKGKVRYKVKLMGQAGCHEDYAEFEDRCGEVCGKLMAFRRYGRIRCGLGEVKRDMQQRRLVRELEVIFEVWLKENAQAEDGKEAGT